MTQAVRALWARTKLQVHSEPLSLVSLPPSSAAAAAGLMAAQRTPFAALLLEPSEVSLTLPEQTWKAHRARFPGARESGPFRAITFDLEVDLAVSGYFAPAAARLAKAGISIVPQCAFLKDHLLVRSGDLSNAIAILQALIREST